MRISMFSPAFLSLFMKIPLLCSLQISVKLTAKILSLSPQNVMAKRIAKRFAVTSSVVTIYDTIRYDIAQFIIQQVYRRRYESRRSSKPKLHLNKKNTWRKTIFNMADGIILHPAVWHVALESWQWIHQVAAPCNVIRGSGMTCRWIHPVEAPCNVTHSSGIMTLNLPDGSTLQCGRWFWDDMPWNSPKRPPYWNSTSHFGFDHITKSTCHSAPVCEILSKSDHRQQKQEAQLSQRGRTMLRVCL